VSHPTASGPCYDCIYIDQNLVCTDVLDDLCCKLHWQWKCWRVPMMNEHVNCFSSPCPKFFSPPFIFWRGCCLHKIYISLAETMAMFKIQPWNHVTLPYGMLGPTLGRHSSKDNPPTCFWRVFVRDCQEFGKVSWQLNFSPKTQDCYLCECKEQPISLIHYTWRI